MKLTSIKVLLSFIILVVLGGLGFAWSGLYNIAANDKHWGITSEFLEIVRERSISTNAEKITVPDLSDQARIKRGAANYDAMCAQCHLAPGMKTSELHEGLYPQPPVLYKELDMSKEKPYELHWVIKNGIKLTGMPAWGNYNSDEQIWDMIATIGAMKNMTQEEYQTLVAAGEHTHAMGGHGDTGMDHHGNNSQEKMSDHHAAEEGQSDHHATEEVKPGKQESAPHSHGGKDHHH